MRPAWSRLILGAAVVLVAGIALVSQARVFRGGGYDLFEPGSFGSELFKTVMRINGAAAEVSVTVCQEGLAAVREAMTAYRNDPRSGFGAGESLGLGVASKGNQTVKLVTLAPTPESPVMMVSVVQSEAEQAASARAAVRHILPDVPVPPDGVVLSSLKNDETRTALERVSSRMAREDLARYYSGAMARQGWVRAFRVAGRTGLSAYVKGADLCWVRIGDEDSNGEIRVTLLHKPGAVR